MCYVDFITLKMVRDLQKDLKPQRLCWGNCIERIVFDLSCFCWFETSSIRLTHELEGCVDHYKVTFLIIHCLSIFLIFVTHSRFWKTSKIRVKREFHPFHFATLFYIACQTQSNQLILYFISTTYFLKQSIFSANFHCSKHIGGEDHGS